MNKETVNCYNVFTGKYFQVLKDDIELLSQGQLPLKKKPSQSCKKCYGRGYTGKSLTDFTYSPCVCLRKQIDLDLYKKLLKEENLADLQLS
jgi:hypothetical protein